MAANFDIPQNPWWRVVEQDQATRLTAPAPAQARSRLCRNRGWQLGEPHHQVGFVKMWKPRAVDLRFFFAGHRFMSPDFPENEKRETKEASIGNKTPLEADELAHRLGLTLQAPPELMLRTNGPLVWPHVLFPYQQEGVHALLESPHLLLADEMGLGKTIMCIAALRVLLHRREVERNLIVTPAGLQEQWRRELQEWAPELLVMMIGGAAADRHWQWSYRAHVTLVSYEMLRADWNETENRNLQGPAQVAWSVIVLDEAQRIKNRDTSLARACKKLSRTKSWALTGTPLENCADDVFSILEFVTGSHCATPITPNQLLRPALQRYQLRRRKVDVLADLPPKMTSDLVLPLTPPQRHAYDIAEKEGLIELREAGKIRELPIENVLALITRLKQICNFAPNGASSKMDDLEERIEEITANRQKTLIFTQYISEESGARRIAQRLEKFAPLLYTGEMDARERNRAIDSFNQDEARGTLVLSLRAGGQGLNLQRASYVFHFDRWWNPAALQQAEDRTHRLGQTQPVHVYSYLMQDTIEARIENILRGKTDLFDQLVEGASLETKHLFSRETLFPKAGL